MVAAVGQPVDVVDDVGHRRGGKDQDVVPALRETIGVRARRSPTSNPSGCGTPRRFMNTMPAAISSATALATASHAASGPTPSRLAHNEVSETFRVSRSVPCVVVVTVRHQS
jgi:hypothetical protein